MRRISVSSLVIALAVAAIPLDTAWGRPLDSPGSGAPLAFHVAATGGFECLVEERAQTTPRADAGVVTSLGQELRTLRYVLLATGEFTVASGGVAGALAELNSVVDAMNAILERDAAVHLEVVAIIPFDDPATDPYPTGASFVDLLDRNTVVADSIVGPDQYDIGQCVTQIPGSVTRGASYFPSLCSPLKAGSIVARGGTDSSYLLHALCHELGHALGGATHTQDRACNRSAATPYEWGSGLTLMSSMPAACPADVQPVVDFYYHVASIGQFIATLGNQPGCGVTSASGNTPPTVDAGPDYTIPRATPFVLSGSGQDPDAADALTFTWEQYDKAPGAFDPVLGPLFRWRPPGALPVRACPVLASLLSGVPEAGETLPTVDRLMHFRLVARDNHPGAGGVSWDEAVITVSGEPFAVSGPNGGESIPSGFFDVTWVVGGGGVASSVAILLSTDGGTDWITLASNTANDGAETVQYVTPIALEECRIKVAALGNVFYDVSDADFRIEADVPTPVELWSFDYEVREAALAIRWRLADPFRFARVAVERADAPEGPWRELGGEPYLEDGAGVLLDDTVAPAHTYFYHLATELADGSQRTLGLLEASLPLPSALQVTSVRPNPAHRSITAEYSVADRQRVIVRVLDVRGRLIATLWDGVREPGRHQAGWVLHGQGLEPPPGLYFLQVEAIGVRAASKFVIVP